MAAAAEPIVDAFHNHRRVFVYAALLLVATGLVFIGVGKHPGQPGTVTTLPGIGRFDGDVLTWIDAHRNAVATAIAKGLNLIGSGVVTIPLRIVVAVYLLLRRRRRAFVTWILVWIIAEVSLTLAKGWYMRTRPPDPLVLASGFSFPSGHTVATAAIAVALVIVSMPAGDRRRKWELAAAAAAFVMGLSRVYLNAHWFSDVVAGALLGTAVALGCAALVTEVFAIARNRRSARSGTSPLASAPGEGGGEGMP
jgi:membrane-associated phospholipid phosphatase